MNTILLQAVETSSIDWVQMMLTVGTIVTGTGMLKLIKLITKNRREKREALNADSEELKDTLRDKVDELEDKVDELQSKIDQMMEMYNDKILELSKANATLETENIYLKKTNEEQKILIGKLRAKLNK